MEGVSAITGLESLAVSSEIGVKALKSAIENSEEQLTTLIEGLGENLDLSA